MYLCSRMREINWNYFSFPDDDHHDDDDDDDDDDELFLWYG